MKAGDDVVVVTWRTGPTAACWSCICATTSWLPLTGVFGTRSPHRPNPLGLHRVTVRELSGTRSRIGPIEAIDGTLVVDVKAVLADVADS